MLKVSEWKHTGFYIIGLVRLRGTNAKGEFYMMQGVFCRKIPVSVTNKTISTHPIQLNLKDILITNYIL